jgi:hypothetical protein
MARSGSNREVSLPDFASWKNSQKLSRGCDAIAHLKFTGLDAAVAIPHGAGLEFIAMEGPMVACGRPGRRWNIAEILSRPGSRLGGSHSPPRGVTLLSGLVYPSGWPEKPRIERPAGIQDCKSCTTFGGEQNLK